jgi:ribonuclease P protein subunit POP4
MRDSENLLQHELIGLRLRVVRSRDEGRLNMEGTVVDETREMFVIEDGTLRRIPKRGSSFELTLEDGSTVVLEGDDLAYRPEDRVKRASRQKARSRARKG